MFFDVGGVTLTEGNTVADLLTELKQRRGCSYEQIGRRTHLSRSTVHRYFTGQSVPGSFGVVERMALACGADKADLAALHRLWQPDQEEPPRLPEPRPGRGRKMTVAGIAVVVAVAVGVAFSLTSDEPVRTNGTEIASMMWSAQPRQIPPEYFGTTINSTTGKMPTFPIGSVRLWDSGTLWHNIQPSRDRHDWSTLDRLVSGAQRNGRAVLFTFGGTPDWASPAGPVTVYGDGSRAAPPDDLRDWDHFVRALAARYQGRIHAYELWDMANHPAFYSGPLETMVEMVRRAAAAIREIDPGAVVVCPSMGELWDPAARRTMEQFGELGGYGPCDAAAVKLYQQKSADPPEKVTELDIELERSFHRMQTGEKPLWSTGPNLDIPLHKQLDPELSADYAARFYLAGLHMQFARMYFYSWGGSKVPVVLQAEQGPPTKAAVFLEELQRWISGARVHSCGHGQFAGLADNVWQCRFDRDGAEFQIWWTHEGTATITAPEHTSSVEHLDRTSRRIRGGDTLEITGRPVLLRLT